MFLLRQFEVKLFFYFLSLSFFFFLIYALVYAFLSPISAADTICCVTYTSRQTPAYYRLLLT